MISIQIRNEVKGKELGFAPYVFIHFLCGSAVLWAILLGFVFWFFQSLWFANFVLYRPNTRTLKHYGTEQMMPLIR